MFGGFRDEATKQGIKKMNTKTTDQLIKDWQQTDREIKEAFDSLKTALNCIDHINSQLEQNKRTIEQIIANNNEPNEQNKQTN